MSKTHKAQKPDGKPRQSPGARRTGFPPPDTALVPSEPSPKLAKEVPELATPIQEEDPKKQWWYREPTSKQRETAAKIAVLDAAGHKDAVIAEKLKTTERNIQQVRYLARKNGWWDKDDHPIDIEEDLALSVDRKVVRNISATLDGKMTNWQTHEMTIAAAKGRGIFKNHEKSEAQTNVLAPVAIQIVMPAIGAEDQKIEIPSHMVGGTPAYVEGEVINGALPALPTSSDAK